MQETFVMLHGSNLKFGDDGDVTTVDIEIDEYALK
jgi:hypothetical protein